MAGHYLKVFHSSLRQSPVNAACLPVPFPDKIGHGCRTPSSYICRYREGRHDTAIDDVQNGFSKGLARVMISRTCAFS